MNFSIVLASRNRPQLLSNLIQSVKKTTSNIDQVEVLVGIDDDDNVYKSLSKQLRSNYPFVKFFTRSRSPWLNRDYLNWISKEHSSGKYLIICNDDTEFKTQNWDNIIINRLRDYLADKPDGIVYGHLNDALHMSYCCFPLISRKAHDALGYSMPPEYPSWNADIFLWDVYNGIGRVCHMPEVLVDHISYHTGKREKDDINHHVRDLNNRGGFSIPSAESARQKLTQAIKLGSKFMVSNMSVVSPKVSIILSGINSERWENLIYTNGCNHDWEFVIVSPKEIPSQLKGCHRLTYVVDKGSPVRGLCIGASCAKGKYFTWGSDDAVFVPGTLNKMIDLLDSSNKLKDVIVARHIDKNNKISSDASMKLNNKYPKSSSVSDDWWDFNCCMMRSTYYRNIGGFDTSFNLHSTSCADLAVRVQRDNSYVELLEDPLLDYSVIQSKDKIIEKVKKVHDLPNYSKICDISHRIAIDLSNWEKSPSEWLEREKLTLI